MSTEGGDWDEETDPTRHRRGPGDEEDYQTPVKIGRLRLDEGSEEEVEKARRVKWDRGLQTARILDEILPHPPKASTMPDRSLKRGCLTAAAKALQLDTLGNLPASSPLKDLIPENVVVKKFVYDNDEEAQPPPPPPEPKATRSRKKAKA
ncbi:hypothetical protein BD626DRAFT_409067 [Schizophyllum amplum]|uniref:Uncharacterized protein n=1 Tax=Schizophyllum amplum TaxID=97359 RepID=A0A550C3I6_9AGAR|nr:hypothetical protein BD626DRAFT_409067 [Auriculariopsis ampla]